MRLSVTVNRVRREVDAEPGETLLELLRRLGHKGVKKGCGVGDCGACTVLLNGRAVNSCLVLAGKADGAEVVTIEGLAEADRLHPLQEALLAEGGVQCGYCTPGMTLAALDLLTHHPDPSEEEIREGISGNLCRCTGYVKQVRAIQAAAQAMKEAGRG